MDSSSDSNDSGSEVEMEADGESGHKSKIREDLSSMSFEEIMKLKEELGAKVYKEAIFGVSTSHGRKAHGDAKINEAAAFKRANKNRPREASAKRQVPFLGIELRTKKDKEEEEVRDPRFDEKAGVYDANTFKEHYKFVTKIRHKEVHTLKKQLQHTTDTEKRDSIKSTMQRMINKNVEDRRWQMKQKLAKQEQKEALQARAEGKQPHYLSQKERRAKDLVMQFEHLKKTGKLNKHLEKRRKKNAAKDRKKFSFD